MTRTVTRFSTLAALLLLAACSGGSQGEDTAAADTLTRRQKDSIISTMPIPGAGGVGRAMRAADSARARAEAHDSLLDGSRRP